jgi:hypothetical protein
MAKRTQPSSLRAPVSRAPAAPSAEVAQASTRFDPPHVIAGSEVAADAAPPAATGHFESELSPHADPTRLAPLASPPLDVPAWEQMERQAGEIAVHLARQQTTLDHREAELNARAAAVENQVRAARLWLAEKLEMLAQHKGDLPWSVPPGTANPTAGAPAGERRAPLSQSVEFWKHESWQEQFEEWRSFSEESSLADPPAETAPASAVGSAARSAAPDQRAEGLERRLAARAAELDARRAELVADRQALETEREAFYVERQEARWRLAEERRAISEKLTRQRARLRRRREDFDARETALRQMRADLLRSQQQTLEMRLAAEELWARLRAKGAAANATIPRHPLAGWNDDELIGTA